MSGDGMQFDIHAPGAKADQGKERWDLLPLDPINQVVQIMTFGANKYTENGWKLVDNASERYFSAMMRHLVAHRSGEKLDPESGMTHLAHAACNVIFLMELSND